MARGFLSGLLAGSAVSGLAAGAVSLAVGLPERLQPPPPLQPPLTEAQDVTAPQDSPSADPAARPATDAPLDASGVSEIETPVTESALNAEATDPGRPPEVATSVEAPSGVTGSELDGATSSPQDAPPTPSTTAPAPAAPDAEAAPQVNTGPVPPPAPTTPDSPELGAAVDEDAVVPEVDAPAPRQMPTVTSEETAALVPQIGQPAGSLINRNPAVPTRRPSAETPAPDDQQATPAGDMTPLQRFAAPVESAENSPRMAIVLLHDGAGPLGPSAMADFPFAVTVAVDSALPDASDIMEGYRAAGFEVMALLDVPAGTSGFDVDAVAQAALAKVPQAVAIMEGLSDGLQGSREITDQLAQYLSQTGHGLVMLPNGLNTAQALVAREGVPSVSVFRDFDGNGQDGRVMRRFLDGAAFNARRDGPVVMLGRMRPDTISALLLWGLQDRANTLQFVPISDVLLNPEG